MEDKMASLLVSNGWHQEVFLKLHIVVLIHQCQVLYCKIITNFNMFTVVVYLEMYVNSG